MISRPLAMVAWMAVLVAAAVLIGRWLGGTGASSVRPERTVREILDGRYAGGEIDRDEYLRRRQDFDGRWPAAAEGVSISCRTFSLPTSPRYG